jgi:hypothetical protein
MPYSQGRSISATRSEDAVAVIPPNLWLSFVVGMAVDEHSVASNDWVRRFPDALPAAGSAREIATASELNDGVIEPRVASRVINECGWNRQSWPRDSRRLPRLGAPAADSRVRAQNAPRRSRSHPIAKVIDPALRQRLASAARRNADRYAVSQTIHNFGSLIMLAVTAGAFLLVTWVATKGLFFFLQESPIRWKLFSAFGEFSAGGSCTNCFQGDEGHQLYLGG